MANPTTKLMPANMIGGSLGTAAVQLIGFNPARNGLIITNLHATQTMSIANSQNAAPTSLGSGTLTIPAASSVQFGAPGPFLSSGGVLLAFGFVWTDVINAIASGASTPWTITEF